VDVRIGLVYSARELEPELPDDTDVDALKAQVADVLGDDDGVLWLTDKKGNQVGLVAGKVTFVHIGSAGDKGRIGFG
jgi:Protein of unknown function (DUF3107)